MTEELEPEIVVLEELLERLRKIVLDGDVPMEMLSRVRCRINHDDREADRYAESGE
jgi:hypothetical protein